MEELLKDLEAKWRQVSGYDDIEATLWTPGVPVADKCPAGCRVVDTDWRSMLQDGEGVDGYRRTVFCRKHGWARIFVIGGPTAEEHGWSPPKA